MKRPGAAQGESSRREIPLYADHRDVDGYGALAQRSSMKPTEELAFDKRSTARLTRKFDVKRAVASWRSRSSVGSVASESNTMPVPAPGRVVLMILAALLVAGVFA
jgi:hypothetical protein